MKKCVRSAVVLLLVTVFFCVPVNGAAREFHWYCTRQKAHRQAIAAPELRFAEDHGAYYIDHTHGDDNEDKVVYLTFDAGYENGNVEKILNTLKDTGTPAAFFVLKHFATANTSLLHRMINEGHLVCNHTAHHKNLSDATLEEVTAELKKLEFACSEAGVTVSPYFRPPEGSFSEELLNMVQTLGYKTVFWSFAYADWDNLHQPNPEHALRCVMNNIHNGAVLLLHPTSATNAEILPQIIRMLKEEGYRFGTLNELCGD